MNNKELYEKTGLLGVPMVHVESKTQRYHIPADYNLDGSLTKTCADLAKGLSGKHGKVLYLMPLSEKRQNSK
ncbi:MAG: hypothetical protein V2B18_25815 [Pseudomonadota bacterium]